MGILFGVASVIAMMAIGRGARQEILDQMRLLGANNVIVTPKFEPSELPAPNAEGKADIPSMSSPGLTLRDAQSLVETVPQIAAVSGEIVIPASISRDSRRGAGKLVGVDANYFNLTNLPIVQGADFTPFQIEYGTPTCVIGHKVATQFFVGQDPIGKQIKAGDLWLTVVGVAGARPMNGQVAEKLGLRDPNLDVYVPISTLLLRVRDRTRPLPKAALNLQQQRAMAAAMRSGGGGGNNRGRQQQNIQEETDEQRRERLNYHQLDRVIVRATEARYVNSVSDVVTRMLTRRHNNVADFTVTVPEMLLKQEQRARTIFNVVLGSIASISLLVGGIGIMNIMLASVLERIREVGVRRAVGAKKQDILFQFLAEAVFIGLAGGMAGVILGVTLSWGIARFAEIKTVVAISSIVLSVGVSVTVGLIFGIVPAWRAAQQDPALCLRHE